MAGSSALPPVRSISLPSRLQPTSVKIEDELDKLKAWQASSVSATEAIGADTIQKGLVGLPELYTRVVELISAPLTQQALIRHQDEKVVEEALDCSVTLLDTCGTARDMLSLMKEHLQHLQSALRRRAAESSIECSIGAYITFKKKAKKDISKCIRALKQMESKTGSFPVLVLDDHLSMVVRLPREVSTIAICVFRSLLLFLSMPVMKSKLGGWSLISKLMPTGLAVHEKRQKMINEVGSVDVALCALYGHVQNNGVKAEFQLVQRKMEILAAGMDSLEAGLDFVFRRLIQYRVSLLTVLTN
ncbi:uncharacterized protein LOC132316300 [Cornus florida]|uniref:uncharacterized protein LOC132316300 n=1 Tax=Cornus florida TaxID=4283 RepID=UPI00289B0145|nr:uncharacterized protein LOC132316300 [Cornus florida]